MRGDVLGVGARRSRTDADANNLNSRYSNLIRKELNSISGGCPCINWGVSAYQLGGVHLPLSFLNILYKLTNKATRYLCNILLKLYKEINPLSKGLYCCFNCDNSLQAYKEYNIIILYTKNIAKSKYLKDLFINIKK